jgi:hypothetical protein
MCELLSMQYRPTYDDSIKEYLCIIITEKVHHILYIRWKALLAFKIHSSDHIMKYFLEHYIVHMKLHPDL